VALHPKRKPRDGVDSYGRSPLHHAVIEDDIILAKSLLSSSAEINLQDDAGYSPLFFAAQNKSLPMIDLLLERKADPNLLDKNGASVLCRALLETRGNADQDAAVLQRLLAHGANIDATTANWAKWRKDGHVVSESTSQAKEAVTALLAEHFTKAKPNW
jgi:ankyrin repeat protein